MTNKGQSTATADPYGMTNKKDTAKQIQGFFPSPSLSVSVISKLRSRCRVVEDVTVKGWVSLLTGEVYGEPFIGSLCLSSVCPVCDNSWTRWRILMKLKTYNLWTLTKVKFEDGSRRSKGHGNTDVTRWARWLHSRYRFISSFSVLMRTFCVSVCPSVPTITFESFNIFKIWLRISNIEVPGTNLCYFVLSTGTLPGRSGGGRHIFK